MINYGDPIEVTATVVATNKRFKLNVKVPEGLHAQALVLAKCKDCGTVHLARVETLCKGGGFVHECTIVDQAKFVSANLAVTGFPAKIEVVSERLQNCLTASSEEEFMKKVVHESFGAQVYKILSTRS
jgi:hypothetical protein